MYRSTATECREPRGLFHNAVSGRAAKAHPSTPDVSSVTGDGFSRSHGQKIRSDVGEHFGNFLIRRWSHSTVLSDLTIRRWYRDSQPRPVGAGSGGVCLIVP